MEDKNVSLELKEEIKNRIEELQKANPKIKKINPIVVFGEDGDAKEMYVVYLRQPSFAAFSKFMSMQKKDEVSAMRQLATDCYVDGDKELIDDDSLFLFGLVGQLSEIISTRQSKLVTF